MVVGLCVACGVGGGCCSDGDGDDDGGGGGGGGCGGWWWGESLKSVRVCVHVEMLEKIEGSQKMGCGLYMGGRILVKRYCTTIIV